MALQQRLIGVREAANYLGIRRSTLYSWAERRKIPSVKMGARLLFDLVDLDELIETAKRPVKASPRTNGGRDDGRLPSLAESSGTE